MKSLRLRFFLLSWPVVVAAVAGVTLTFDRWTAVELRVLEDDARPPPELPPGAADSVAAAAARWALGDRSTPLATVLVPAASMAGADVVVVAADGSVVAATDPSIRLLERADGAALFDHTTERDGLIRSNRLRVSAVPVPGSEGWSAYLLPRPHAGRDDEPALAGLPDRVDAIRADARRTLWTAFLLASVAAAVVSLLLARPVVAQIGRLARAAEAVGEGDLGVRVPPTGRDELARLERSFNEMTGALERADRHKRSLVTDVAHELRTPLTNLLGMVEALEDGLMPTDAGSLARLREEVGLLTALVADLDELSLAESGQMDLRLEAVDVAAEARSAVNAMHRVGEGVTVVGPDPAAGPAVAHADRRRLGQVLRNLLRNALAHTPPGGRVDVSVQVRADTVVIAVDDDGAGIPPEHLDRIWDRFHRVDASRDRASGGRGLGLAIVRHLVEAMDGSVGVTSEVGRGARFEVVLPGVTDPTAPAGSPPSE